MFPHVNFVFSHDGHFGREGGEGCTGLSTRGTPPRGGGAHRSEHNAPASKGDECSGGCELFTPSNSRRRTTPKGPVARAESSAGLAKRKASVEDALLMTTSSMGAAGDVAAGPMALPGKGMGAARADASAAGGHQGQGDAVEEGGGGERLCTNNGPFLR